MLNVVAAILRQGDDVLLVEQQGPRDRTPNWSVPGGVVEGNELLLEALGREVFEETGLLIDAYDSLACITHFDTLVGTPYIVHTFTVAAWHGTLNVNDPDDHILRAVFLPKATAIARLTEDQPWQVTREPLLAYLTGSARNGAAWFYRDDGNGVRLVQQLDGPD